MNPQYHFFLQEKTANLLNPHLLKKQESNLYLSDFIPVDVGKQYGVRVLGGEKPTTGKYRIIKYSADKTFAGVSYDDTVITASYHYIRILIDKEHNLDDYGVFVNPTNSFEYWEAGIVHPIWKDLTIEYAKENNQMFFRKKLSGKLTFVQDDYEFIKSSYFEQTFHLDILNTDWNIYWQGIFYCIDCEFNDDDKNLKVTPNVLDEYTDILENYEKEFDLIKLTPPITQINFAKRLILQIYKRGGDSIANFARGSYWVADASSEDSHTNLNNMGFRCVKCVRKIRISGSTIEDVNDSHFYGDCTSSNQSDPIDHSGYRYRGIYIDGFASGYYFELTKTTTYPNVYIYTWVLKDSNDQVIAGYEETRTGDYEPTTVILQAGTIQVTATIEFEYYYGRYLSDVANVDGVNGHVITPNDIAYTMNYKYSYMPTPETYKNFIEPRLTIQVEPTEYGKWGNYYYGKPISSELRPLTQPDFVPLNRSEWDDYCVWFNMDIWPQITITQENKFAQTTLLRDSYKVSDLINKILSEFSRIVHSASADYSKFLYYNYGQGIEPNLPVDLYITPKSNILKSQYDQPAQQSPITLKLIMDVFRDMFKCYWYIDNGKFKIEHIKFFMNGGDYTGTTGMGIDLTKEIVTRNGKPWAYCLNKWRFEKENIVSQYKFGWADDVTDIFVGKTLDVQSKFAKTGSVEEITINKITTDIDYMLVSPSSFSEEGYAMLGCAHGTDIVAMWPDDNNISQSRYQNYYLAFDWLYRYYTYDLPTSNVKYGDASVGNGVKKLKSQEVTFPALSDPDMYKLIKTDLGLGQIEKVSINLTSRLAKATLLYDTI